VDGRDGEGDEDFGPGFVATHGFEILDPLVFAQALQDEGHLIPTFIDAETRDRLADHLVGAIAEQALGPGVPTRDHAVHGLADDRVVGRGDYGGEQGFAFPQGRGAALDLGHVVTADEDAGDLAGVVPDRLEVQIDIAGVLLARKPNRRGAGAEGDAGSKDLVQGLEETLPFDLETCGPVPTASPRTPASAAASAVAAPARSQAAVAPGPFR
jgi:hypothetical protein